MAEGMFISVDFSNHPELLEGLQKMVAEDKDMDRSKFVRKLVRKELTRRARRDAMKQDAPQHKAVAA